VTINAVVFDLQLGLKKGGYVNRPCLILSYFEGRLPEFDGYLSW
jgi:hypothetical protein